MTTPKNGDAEVVSKNRLKRRLLRNISKAMKRKHDEARKPLIQDSMTDSDDSESETQEVLKHQLFASKRLIDQTHEGDILKSAMTKQSPPSLLLPLCEADIEPLDKHYEQVGFVRQDSNSTIRSHDSLSQRLAEVDTGSKPPVVVDALHTFADDSESVKIFTDDTSVSTGIDASVAASISTKGGRRRKRNLRWADEHGGELEIHHWTLTMYSEEENDWMRAIVLLLSPKKKKFEFLHISYNLLERTSIKDILMQLPEISTDEALKEQRYVGLIRRKGGRELINTVSIQSYCLEKNEVLVGVVEGHHGKAISRMAEPLLGNKKIMRAVTRSKSKKICVKQLESLPSKKKSKSKGKAKKDSKFFPMRRREEPQHDDSSDRPQVRDEQDEDELEIPDLFCEPEREAYYASESNRDKITLTRFVNASILTAVVCGVQRTVASRAFGRSSKRR